MLVTCFIKRGAHNLEGDGGAEALALVCANHIHLLRARVRVSGRECVSVSASERVCARVRDRVTVKLNQIKKLWESKSTHMLVQLRGVALILLERVSESKSERE